MGASVSRHGDYENALRSAYFFPKIFGLDESKKRILELLALAQNEISVFGERARPLQYMAESIINREF